MTYRQGHHSTSDDSTRYRSESEIEDFVDRMDPLHRLNNFLKRHNMLTDEEIATISDEGRIAVLNAIKQAEQRPKPSLESMFEDVYHDVPKHLQKQLRELKEHLALYSGKY
jgi:2-oxoisovalerate dehydrogenase E1 component alpha subunit